MRQLPVVALLSLLLLSACDGGSTTPATQPVAPASPEPADQPPASVPPATAPVTAPAVATAAARFDGYGALRFGMDEAEARAAWEGELDGRPDPGCHYLFPAGNAVPSDFALMFEDGRLVRYDVGNDKVVAPGGGRVGMTADEIRAAYPGRVSESPHKYVEGGSVLRIAAPGGDGEGVLVFATDADGKVSEWRAGIAPQVDYVEGCS
jgi:hypothetical protein